MKQSYYNIFIPRSGFTILYNSFTDRFLGISKKADNLLNSDIERLNRQMPSVCKRMQELGMLVDDEKDQLALIEQQYTNAKFNNRNLYFMVYPTQDCNLKCWYCYESHKKGTRMSQKVLESVLNFVDKGIENDDFDSIHLAFFGGEPLLNFTKIAYPMAYAIKEKCQNAGKKFSSFFVTNASLMTDEMIDKLSTLAPYFQITIDGDKKKHDTVRIWKYDNKGTYHQIIHAVKMLTSKIQNPSYSDDPLVTLRINYDNATLLNIDSLLEDLKNVDRSKVRVHFERVWQTRSVVEDEQRQLLLKALAKFVKEGFIISHGVFRKKNIACPSDSNSFFIVNYDGTIHKCNGRTLGDATQEGILQFDGSIQWNESKRERRLKLKTFDNANCLTCKMLPLCMGPCSQKMLEKGRFTKDICSKHSLDVSFEEYLSFEFEMRYYLEQINHTV